MIQSLSKYQAKKKVFNSGKQLYVKPLKRQFIFQSNRNFQDFFVNVNNNNNNNNSGIKIIL